MHADDMRKDGDQVLSKVVWDQPAEYGAHVLHDFGVGVVEGHCFTRLFSRASTCFSDSSSKRGMCWNTDSGRCQVRSASATISTNHARKASGSMITSASLK